MILAIILLFLLGYIAIAFEHQIRVNKAATALIMGVVIWTIYVVGAPLLVNVLNQEELHHFVSANPGYENKSLLQQCILYITHFQLIEHLGDISGTLFFLMGAMTIVEIIDGHNGFQIITNRIRTRNKHKLMWIITIVTFFMSAILDNMTTAIVMAMLLRKIIRNYKERWLFSSMVIIAANSGGAWSPIGDITTIMLWMADTISVGTIIPHLIVPSLLSVVLPVIIANRKLKGIIAEQARLTGEAPKKEIESIITNKERKSIFILGVGCLVATPVFKTLTHLPPYMGILLALGIIWLYTEIIYRKKVNIPEDQKMRVPDAIKRIDLPTILFFLGILLAVNGLEVIGALKDFSHFLDTHLHNIFIINLIIGFISSIVDNVPLVASAIGMYPVVDPSTLHTLANPEYMSQFVMDGAFWEFLAYCAGVGGSILIIGSAAGVVVMGIEKINFIWYFKNISFMALIGYLLGAGTYICSYLVFN